MVFDSHCIVGRRCQRLPFEPWKKDDLLKQMDHCGIDRALVKHAVAVEYDPTVGNDLLMDELRNEDRLEPVWVLAPHETSSLEPADAMMQKMSTTGVRAVAVYPGMHGYPFDEFAYKEMFQTLERCRVPVFLSIREASWQSIRQILLAFPSLRLVLTDLGWGAFRYIFPLFREFEHLSVEISGIRPQMGLESVCEHFGSHRILFGSGWPVFAPGAPLTVLNYAFIDDDKRQDIAGLNLLKLLEGGEMP